MEYDPAGSSAIEIEWINYPGLKVSEIASSNSSFVFPNPANDFVNIKVNGISYSEYIITDITGRIIKSGRIDRNKVSVAELKDGVYFITLHENDNVYNQKLIIKH